MIISLWFAITVDLAQAQFASPGFFSPSSKKATFRQVQSASGSALIAGSASITFTSPQAKSLILCAAQTSAGSVSGVSDQGSNSYLSIRDSDTPSGQKLFYTYAVNPPGRITAVVSAVVATAQITCFEFSGVTLNPPDTTDYVAGSGTTVLRYLSTNSSPEFIFAYVFTNKNTVAVGSQYTNIYGGSGSDMAMFTQAPYIGNFKVNFQQASGSYVMVSAAFKLE